MNGVNKTLFIPLYGKALVSKKGIILRDEKAEQIWESEQFPLKGKSKSKWLAYFMSMRSAVFDEWTKDQLAQNPNGVVMHLGCGLDSRVERVGCALPWYDIDFESVIAQRKRYYSETENYKMLAFDITDTRFLDEIAPTSHAIVVMEGVSMYIENETLAQTLSAICDKFSTVSILVDCYTPFGAKMSKIKNPVKEVGVNKVYGVKSPQTLLNGELTFVKEHSLTPNELIEQLNGCEKFIFKTLYAGSISKKIYKLYEYKK